MRILFILFSIMGFISCGPVEQSCGKNKSDLCYTLLGDDDVNQNEYDKDQEELEKFKQEVREEIIALHIDMGALEADITTLGLSFEQNHSELNQAILDMKDDLSDAISDLRNTDAAQFVLIRGLKRKIKQLKNKVKEIKEDYNDLSISCSHYHFFFLTIVNNCELDK